MPPRSTTTERETDVATVARSLARSYLRLSMAYDKAGLRGEVPPAVERALARRTEAMVQIADILATNEPDPGELPGLNRVLDGRRHELERLQNDILTLLPPDKAKVFRRVLLATAVSDQELADETERLRTQAELGELAVSTRREEPATGEEDGGHELPEEEELYRQFLEALDHLQSFLGEAPDSEELWLEQLLDGEDGPLGKLMHSMEVGLRHEQDSKRISLKVKLPTALKALPAQWLHAMTRELGLPSFKRKAQRVDAIVGLLRDSPLEDLATLLEDLDEQERAALAYVLEPDGWRRASAFTRKYGSDEEDGWYWETAPPSSVLGRLRLLGLVFVGRTVINGRNTKVVLVPMDMRERLSIVLSTLG